LRGKFQNTRTQNYQNFSQKDELAKETDRLKKIINLKEEENQDIKEVIES